MALCAVTPGPDEACRYERKFLFGPRDLNTVRSWLKLSGWAFGEAYPPRTVCNVYLDTQTLHNYATSKSGTGDREKVRIRWYEDGSGEAPRSHLEIKAKRGAVGFKKHYPLPGCDPNAIRDARSMVRETDRCGLPERMRLLLAELRPVLQNAYRREYYQSRCGLLRVTLDSDLVFCRPGEPLSSAAPASDLYVLEVKFSSEDALKAAAFQAPGGIRLARCSKYVLGVESLFAVQAI